LDIIKIDYTPVREYKDKDYTPVREYKDKDYTPGRKYRLHTS